MSGYLSYFKIQVISGLQYKAAALAGLSTQFFWGFLFVMVYQSFYSHTNNSSISFPDLVTYVWLQQAFFALIYMRAKDNDILSSIRTGTVAYELCRPYQIYSWWYIKIFAKKYASVTLRFLPIIVVAAILPAPYNLSLPASNLSFMLFLTALLLGSFVLVGISMIVHSLTFFTYQDDGIASLLFLIAEFLSGAFLPLPLMPNIIQKISYFLPFRLIGDLPFRIYSGNIDISNAFLNIGFQFIWIILLILIGKWIMKLSLQKVTIQGG
jgi:ABC-type uncharacterized transport system, permease component